MAPIWIIFIGNICIYTSLCNNHNPVQDSFSRNISEQERPSNDNLHYIHIFPPGETVFLRGPKKSSLDILKAKHILNDPVLPDRSSHCFIPELRSLNDCQS